MALTDVAVRNARPGPKYYKMGESHGLCLLVQPTGGKLWRFKYRVDGREKKLAIDPYPEIGLGEARRRRDEAREALVAGPEERADRTTWRRTMRALGLEGFAEAEINIWTRPDNLEGGADGMRQRLAELEAAPSLLVVRASGLDPGRSARFRTLWDTETLCNGHARLADLLDRSASTIGAADLPEAAATTLLLGREAIRNIMRDPLLPEELCPTDALSRLTASMVRYDHIGKRVWREYLAG